MVQRNKGLKIKLLLKIFSLKVAFLLSSLTMSGQTIDYSDSGNGIHQNKIQWLTWAGTDLDDGIHDGDSVNFNLPLGGNLEVVFSNVSIAYPIPDPTPGDGESPHGYLPADIYPWCGATFYTAYDLSGSTSEMLFSDIDTFGITGNGENGQDINFDVSFKVVINGYTLPADIVVGDPETTNPAFSETITVITNRGSWELIENIRGTNYNLTGLNTTTLSILDTETGFACSGSTNSGTNSSPLLMTEGEPDSVTLLNYDISYPTGEGHEGIVFGLNLPFDQGDAPVTYLVASHLQDMAPIVVGGPGLVNNSILYLGTAPGDPDYHVNQPLFSPTAVGDDNDNLSDENGLSTFSYERSCNGASLVIPSSNITTYNTTGDTALLHVWIDFDQNGTFDGDEYVVANVLNAATNPDDDLTFSVPADFVEGATFARFRLSSDNTLDNNAPSGVAIDGEVEDFSITLSNAGPGCCESKAPNLSKK